MIDVSSTKLAHVLVNNGVTPLEKTAAGAAAGTDHGALSEKQTSFMVTDAFAAISEFLLQQHDNCS